MNFGGMGNIEHASLATQRILVTDGDQRAALAVVRSLGAAGASVVVGAGSGRSIAGASRYASGKVELPDPLASPDAFCDRVLRVIEEQSIDIVIPITEAALRPILAADLGSVILPFPDLATFELASDKYRLTELAARRGVPVPAQGIIESPGSESAPDLPAFPVVLKPAVSVTSTEGARTKLTVSHADDAGALARLIADVPPDAYPLLVQQRIVGPGVGLFLLRWNGRILARFAHRRLREKPPSGGVSVYRESIPLPPDALRHAEALLEELDWNGVAMVEFKVDRSSGVPYLMEMTGRFWGSLQLAIDAGVDFPRLLAEAALGRADGPVVTGESGIRLRWLLGDLDHLLIRLRRSRTELHLPAGSPGRLRALGSFLVPWRRGERLEVLRLSDPAPFVREVSHWIRSL
jgi:hypothetical protein